MITFLIPSVVYHLLFNYKGLKYDLQNLSTYLSCCGSLSGSKERFSLPFSAPLGIQPAGDISLNNDYSESSGIPPNKSAESIGKDGELETDCKRKGSVTTDEEFMMRMLVELGYI